MTSNQFETVSHFEKVRNSFTQRGQSLPSLKSQNYPQLQLVRIFLGLVRTSVYKFEPVRITFNQLGTVMGRGHDFPLGKVSWMIDNPCVLLESRPGTEK